ncbi:MAG: KTSC domain-containing protein [Candidatus Omnitrophota bacterium]
MINQMVLSTEIEWIGYERKTKVLQVEFIAGATYQYQNVPEFIFQNFLNAPSHCQFLDQNIKGKFPYRKIR